MTIKSLWNFNRKRGSVDLHKQESQIISTTDSADYSMQNEGKKSKSIKLSAKFI